MGGGKTPPKIPRKRYLLAQAGQLLLSRQFAIFSFRVLGLGTPFPRRGKGFFFLDSWGVAHSAPPGFHSYSSGAKCALRGIRSIPRPVRLTQTAGPPTHQVNQARSEWAEPLSRECFSTLSAGFPQVQRNHPPGFFVAPRTNSSHDSAILKSAHWLYCKPDKHAFPSTPPRIAAHGYLSSRAINL